ncbi:hypothetical protein RD110_05925 [Rhodoferax koreense]|uniref:Glycine zipper 2TM domain-containing protein n=1 Tax=Rhodoferax koreensis TaxID=1842727 RepID=A0A1P8JSR0_9BURK|nr:hypothetical protein [Rhodoferax koreense]APW36786.1 hypothetical protein RD110_05925 [Rhodoferax koreense]
MKKIILLSALTLSTGLTFAQEVGRVLSSTPVVQQVSVPRQVCSTQQVAVEPQKSGAGALLGMIAGGVLGNTIGHGGGRAAATALGVVGGAMVGDRVEGSGAPYYQNVQNCGTQNFYENRTVGYNVVYEYNGRQYNVQLAQDPGPTIPLQVTPAANSAPPPVQAPVQTISSQPYAPQPVYVQQPTWYQATPYVRPYVAPVSVDLNLGYVWGGGGYRHGWR